MRGELDVGIVREMTDALGEPGPEVVERHDPARPLTGLAVPRREDVEHEAAEEAAGAREEERRPPERPQLVVEIGGDLPGIASE